MACCTLWILPMDTLGSFCVQRGRPPKARGDAEPIRMGALGREHLLMAPPAGAPAAASAAAPAAVAEPSVPIATEASSAQSSSTSSSSSSSSPASPRAVPQPEAEMTDSAAERKRDLPLRQMRRTVGRWLSRTSVSDSKMRSRW